MPKTKKQTKIKVLDTSEFSLTSYPYEKFDTLHEAFKWIAGEFLDGCSTSFEVEIPGSDTTIRIDADDVDFDEIT